MSENDQLSAFHPDDPNLQIAWDSVSMGALQLCPLNYKLSILEGWTRKETVVDLEFGIIFHRCMELYFKQLASGVPHNDALVQATLLAMRMSKESIPEEPTVKADAARANPKTRFTLVRSVVWYLDKYHESTAETVIRPDGTPAVELSFRIALELEHSRGPYLLCGHIDRVVEENGRRLISDYKTTAKTLSDSFFRGFDLDWQITNYVFAASVLLNEAISGARIDGVQIALGFTRINKGYTYRTPSQITEWLRDTFTWIKQAEAYAEANHWPQNLRSCWSCRFKEVCAKAPGVRQEWLKADFEQRERWNPLRNR